MKIPPGPRYDDTMEKRNKKDVQLVMKPIGALGGLDTIHVALILLAAILILLLLMVAYQKSVLLNGNITSSAATTATIRGYAPMHNESQVIKQASRILASYNYANGYLSLLPYFSSVNNISAYYIPASREWYVKIPESIGNATGYYSFVLYDSNLSLDIAYSQLPKISKVLGNYVAAKGTIKLNGKFACGSNSSASIYWFMDPYSPGAIESLVNLTALEDKYGMSLNASLKMLSQGPTYNISERYGLGNAQMLERYLLCASAQKNASAFYSNLLSAYSGYMSPTLLSLLANSSKLDRTSLDSCLANSTVELNRQALLAQYYNITTTPIAVVDCAYLALPQTANEALCYGSPGLCGK